MSRDSLERHTLYFALGILIGLLILSGCAPGGGGSAREGAAPALERPELASRTSGVAPLAVYFDSGAQGEDFLSTEYRWDFGDPLSGTWALSGHSKNLESGPIAGHVYETPGVYVAMLNGTEQVTITVEDPDVVFAGDKTRCFSQTGDFTGAPAGALLTTTSSLSVIAAHLAPGRRLLLRRGETWTAMTSFGGQILGPGTIGAFGSGPSPIIRSSGQVFAPRWTDWRIMDLTIEGTGSSSRAFRSAGQNSQVTLLRLRARNVKTGFSFSTSHMGGSLFDRPAIVECVVENLVGGLGGYGSMFAGSRALFLGNHYLSAEGGEHDVRVPWVEGCVIAHCDLGRPLATKHVLKLHGPVFTGTALGSGRYTERVHVAHNTFRGGLASWVVASAPEDSHTDQRVRTVLFEANRTEAGSSMQNAYQLSCTNSLARNNVVVGTGGQSCTAFSIARRGVEPVPDDIAILHNTAYTADPDRFTLVSVGSGSTNVLVQGNLGSAPNSTNRTLVSGPATSQHNLLTDTPGWLAPPADFSLVAGSVAIDAAPAIAEVWDDFPGTDRGALYDLGAYEFPEEPPPPPPDDPPPEEEPPPEPAATVEIIADAHVAGSGVRKSGPNWMTGNDGEFYPSLVEGGHNEDSLYRKEEGGSYTWRFHSLEPGRWRVEASWTSKSSRSPAALYLVDGHEVRVDQRQGGDLPGEPTTWNLLGEFDLPAGFDVQLVHEGEGVGTAVCADAIRLVR